MGQHITVTVAPGASPSVRIFDLNRSITGMAIERYPSVAAVKAGRPPDVLARRLFDLGADVGDRVLELGHGDRAGRAVGDAGAEGRRDDREPVRLLRRRRGLVARQPPGHRRRAAAHARAHRLTDHAGDHPPEDHPKVKA